MFKSVLNEKGKEKENKNTSQTSTHCGHVAEQQQQLMLQHANMYFPSHQSASHLKVHIYKTKVIFKRTRENNIFFYKRGAGGRGGQHVTPMQRQL